jgi:type I restriction enzyme, S subunit
MNAEMLLTHFNRISDAPDAASRLREFILGLAVRGKLVEQNPKDEAAAGLLARIQVERVQLAKDGQIPKLQPIARIDVDELPFPAPSGWAWTRLASICMRIHYGFTASANNSLKDVRLLRITDIQNNNVNWQNVPGCEIAEGEIPHFRLLAGDILIARTGGTIGKTFLVRQIPVTAVFASYLIRVQKASELYDRYLKLFLESPVYWKQLQEGARGGGQPNVNGQTLGRMLVPVAPKEEQYRIVAKVDELMALCDRLESAQRERERRRDLLAASAHHHLNNGADSEDLRSYATFVIGHLPRITVRPDQVMQLRQTILNLAVRGKLVPQSQSDEPASALLKRILAEKTQLVKEGKIRKQDPQARIQPDAASFSLPGGWQWTRLADVIHLVSGQHLQPNEYSERDDIGLPYITGPADFGARGLEITRYALVRKAVAEKGQILLTVKGAGVGKTAICDLQEVAISRQLMALTAIALESAVPSLSDTPRRQDAHAHGALESAVPSLSDTPAQSPSSVHCSLESAVPSLSDTPPCRGPKGKCSQSDSWNFA